MYMPKIYIGHCWSAPKCFFQFYSCTRVFIIVLSISYERNGYAKFVFIKHYCTIRKTIDEPQSTLSGMHVYNYNVFKHKCLFLFIGIYLRTRKINLF